MKWKTQRARSKAANDPGSGQGMNTLWMDGEEVMVRANQLEFAGDEMEEGMNYYDEELVAVRR